MLAAIALTLASAGAAHADGIFPDCHGEEPCNSFGCSNMSGMTGCQCNASGPTHGEIASVGTTLAILGLAGFLATRKRRGRR